MVDGFLRNLKDAILGPTDQQQEQSGFDPSSQARPASEDPYGDPAYQDQFGDVRPASEDSYGDPADQQNSW